VQAWGALAPLAFVGFVALRPFVFFPSTLLFIAAGLAFGPWLGTLYAVIGATIAAVLTFLLARALGRDFVQARLPSACSACTTESGERADPLLNLVPVVPITAVNYGAGLSRVPLSHYTLAVIGGLTPRAFAYGFFGDSLLEVGSGRFIAAIAFLVALVVVPPGSGGGGSRHARRRHRALDGMPHPGGTVSAVLPRARRLAPPSPGRSAAGEPAHHRALRYLRRNRSCTRSTSRASSTGRASPASTSTSKSSVTRGWASRSGTSSCLRPFPTGGTPVRRRARTRSSPGVARRSCGDGDELDRGSIFDPAQILGTDGRATVGRKKRRPTASTLALRAPDATLVRIVCAASRLLS